MHIQMENQVKKRNGEPQALFRSNSMEFHEINQKLKETKTELLGLLHRLNRDQINHWKDSNSWSIGQSELR